MGKKKRASGAPQASLLLKPPVNLSAYGYPDAGIELRITATPAASDADWLMAGADDLEGRSVVGVAVCTNSKGEIVAVAFASTSRSLFVHLPPSERPKIKPWELATPTGVSPLKGVFDAIDKIDALPVGFHLSRALVLIARQLGLFPDGLDLASVAIDVDHLEAEQVNQAFLPGQKHTVALQNLFDTNGPMPKTSGEVHVPLRAWLACVTTLHASVKKRAWEAQQVWLGDKLPRHVAFFATTIGITDKLEAQKEEFSQTSIDYSRCFLDALKTTLTVKNTYFSLRIRKEKRQTVSVRLQNKAVITGRATGVDGQKTTIKLEGPLATVGHIAIIRVIGKESPSRSDIAWQGVLRRIMAGQESLGNRFLNCLIWQIWDDSKTTAKPAQLLYPLASCSRAQQLNPSQRRAHDAIVSPATSDSAAVIISGPPGTGKTTVIATAIHSWLLSSGTAKGCVYCVAASNVAVKNIAEALEKLSKDKVDRQDFRIIVSGEYYREWHEHQYPFTEQLLVTDELMGLPNAKQLEVHMGKARIILGTLSLLSSKVLDANNFLQLYPPTILLVDEASQIRLDELFYPLVRLSGTLQRAAFFGDAKQLGPHKAGEITEIRSVFETPLGDRAFFLDTQYRMPTNVAAFISSRVHGSKLRSGLKASGDSHCVRFVDTGKRGQKQQGNSVCNPDEVLVIVELVKLYYSKTDFRVLTPYNAQRKAIEDALKKAKLAWEDRVFSVDSFQGHEADVILVSLARTEKLGFLGDQRRSNVMLTRLKKAMVIVTSREYLQEERTKETLIGQLSVHLSNKPETWVSAGDVLAAKAPMPGSSRVKPSNVGQIAAPIAQLPVLAAPVMAKPTASVRPTALPAPAQERKPLTSIRPNTASKDKALKAKAGQPKVVAPTQQGTSRATTPSTASTEEDEFWRPKDRPVPILPLKRKGKPSSASDNPSSQPLPLSFGPAPAVPVKGTHGAKAVLPGRKSLASRLP